MIAFAYKTAFNSAINCTSFEARPGLRARPIIEAQTSLRLQITAEEGTELQEPEYKWESTISQSLQACRAISGRHSATIASEQAHECTKPEPRVISDKPLEQGDKIYISINHLLNKK